MNENTAVEIQRKIGIALEQIVREEYEILILKSLYESPFGGSLVFKGGTALRLAYGSPRFSEDLDFSTVSALNPNKLYTFLEKVAERSDALTLVEGATKRYTYFGLFKVHEGFLKQNFHIKVEISRRLYSLKKGDDYTLMTLSSNVTSLTALAQVITLEEALREKLSIEPKRIRDMFDIWFIGQKLGKTFPMDFSQFDRKEVRQALNRFLPRGERRLFERFLEQ